MFSSRPEPKDKRYSIHILLCVCICVYQTFCSFQPKSNLLKLRDYVLCNVGTLLLYHFYCKIFPRLRHGIFDTYVHIGCYCYPCRLEEDVSVRCCGWANSALSLFFFAVVVHFVCWANVICFKFSVVNFLSTEFAALFVSLTALRSLLVVCCSQPVYISVSRSVWINNNLNTKQHSTAQPK